MAAPPVRLGLRENAAQFALLVAVTAFVGAMVGLERATLPLIGEDDFGVSSAAGVLSFIVAFGAAKALTNLAAGALAERIGRRRLLVLGWVVALPVPALVALAPSWWVVVVANALLGVNQGLTWSMTVVMKIDLVGPKRRGLALGLNEAAGYVAVAATALATGLIAERLGLRPAPFLLELAAAALGLGAVAIAFAFPPCARFTYQIHIPSPRSGFEAGGGNGEGPCARACGEVSASRIAASAAAQRAAATGRVRTAAIVIRLRMP